MQLKNYLNNNLHHAYLIEGDLDTTTSELITTLKELGVNTKGSADFSNIRTDTFKIEDMRNLKSLVGERSFSENKKIFILTVNNFLIEAQNGLLKIFEEPISDTHFFVIVPDINSLLKTFVSRFYVIRDVSKETDSIYAEKFIKMSIKDRVEFIKDLLNKEEIDDENEEKNLESNNKKALSFLNSLELTISKESYILNINAVSYLHHLFEVRRFLRMPGSSVKTLMESLALSVPDFNK